MLIPGKWSAVWSYKVNYDYRMINYSLNTNTQLTNSNRVSDFGNLFTIVNTYNKTITINSLSQGRALNNTSNVVNIDVRYYKGTYTVNSVLSPASSSSDWILLGTFENVQLTKDTNINGQLTQQYTGLLDIPDITFDSGESITFNIDISGATVAIDSASVPSNKQGNVSNSNNHLQILDGHSGSWVNQIWYSNRIWNGTINYSLEGFYTGSGDENVTFDITLDLQNSHLFLMQKELLLPIQIIHV